MVKLRRVVTDEKQTKDENNSSFPENEWLNSLPILNERVLSRTEYLHSQSRQLSNDEIAKLMDKFSDELKWLAK